VGPALRRSAMSVQFGTRLCTALQFGPQAVDDLIRAQDVALADHHRAVADLAVAVGRELGLSGDAVTGIELASTIHDIGVIGSPRRLDIEHGDGWDASGEHASLGATIVDDFRFPWPIGTMILQHHEHTDGSGFPGGLRQQEILFDSRVVAVADAAATMTARGIPPTAAARRLAADCVSHYGTDVVAACIAVLVHRPLPDGVAEPLAS